MIGLAKVTDRILAEARTESERILAAAEDKKAALFAAADEKIAAIREKTEAEIAEEGKNIISRARSASDMQNRNIILESKCASLDAVFAAAEEKILSLPASEYAAFTVSNASCAVRCAPAGSSCVLTFCEKDRETVGALVLSGLQKAFPDVRFSLSDRTAPISGGVLMDFGETDVDCSVHAVLTEIRPSLEGALCELLFESTKNKA